MAWLATLGIPTNFSVHPLELLFAFLISHALADYPLQGKFIAIRKNRHIKSVDYSGDTPPNVWMYCLSAHAFVHAGGVWIILTVFHMPGAVWFALAEFFLHAFIDFAKCEKWTNFHQDQGLHVLCKICYIGVLMAQGHVHF